VNLTSVILLCLVVAVGLSDLRVSLGLGLPLATTTCAPHRHLQVLLPPCCYQWLSRVSDACLQTGHGLPCVEFGTTGKNRCDRIPTRCHVCGREQCLCLIVFVNMIWWRAVAGGVSDSRVSLGLGLSLATTTCAPHRHLQVLLPPCCYQWLSRVSDACLQTDHGLPCVEFGTTGKNRCDRIPTRCHVCGREQCLCLIVPLYVTGRYSAAAVAFPLRCARGYRRAMYSCYHGWSIRQL